MAKIGSKERIKQFLLKNIGRVIDGAEISKASGYAREAARRARELRDEEGWPLLTHNDRADLKPGQYFLESAPVEKRGIEFKRGISAKLRAQVLARNGSVCQMCGAVAGDVDSTTGRKVRLHLGHIKDKSLGGKDEFSNLYALCSTCNQGAKNVTAEKPTWIWLLAQIRKAGRDDQLAAFNWLKTKFDTKT